MIIERHQDGASSDPKAVESTFERALSLRRQGEAPRADALCIELLQIDPRHFNAYHLRGLIALESGETARGIELIGRSLAIHPGQPLAFANVGNALLSAGQPQRALECLDEALRLKPDLADAHYRRGNALKALHRLEPALESYEAALRLNGTHARASNNRGVVLLAMGRFADARESFERALELAPQDCEALHGRGAALLGLERYEEAAQVFEELLRVEPHHESALGNLFHLRMEQCDWHDYEELSNRLVDALRRTKKFVSPLSLLLADDLEISLACARAYVAQTFSKKPSIEPSNSRAHMPAGRRIRVAYVSADFRDHPVAHLLVGVLERHDRERFEVIGISLRPRGSGSFEQRVHDAFDRWIDVSGMRDSDVAELLQELGVDIAVDLMGFTEGSRLGIFAHRAAPVQVSFLGYAGTLGAPFIDYLLADRVVIPSEHERWYDERVVHLPNSYLPTDDRRTVGTRPTRSEVGLPPQGVVFCAIAQAHKIRPRVFDSWMRVLRETDGSVLWLREIGMAAHANLRQAAERRGVAGARLVFAPRVAGTAEHLARLSLADLHLDTLPYNGHSTTCDALWAGVPVLTCVGNAFAGRVAASILTAAGFTELVTSSLDEYERRAIELAHHPEQLNALRSRLALQGKQSPLFDTARYTGHLEAAFRRMFEHAGK